MTLTAFSPIVIPWQSTLPGLLGLTLFACNAVPGVRPESTGPAVVPSAEVIAYESGAGARSRVSRTVAADGTETLHGETDLAFGAHAGRCIVEDTTLDPAGRLLRADVAVAASCGADPESRVHLDPGRGVVLVTTRAGSSERSAPSGAPWIYTPELLPGRALSTPVSAWVAHRAAAASASLTLVRLERQEAWRVPSDQVDVPTELGTTVVLGNDGADVGATFVDRVRLLDYGASLVRVPRGGEPAI